MISPHRPLFAAAAALWLLSALWWCAQLLGLLPGTGLLPPTVLHGWLMGLGFLPLYMAGFACLTLPRWLDQRAVDGARLLAPALGSLLGWLGFLLANAGGWRVPALASALLPGLLNLALSAALLRRCARPGARRSPHAWGIAAGLAGMASCHLVAVVAWAMDALVVLQSALRVGFWLGAGAVFVLALQRLSPFVPERKGLAPGLLSALLLSLLLRCGLDLAGLWSLAVPNLLHLLLACLLLVIGLWVACDAQRSELAAARRAPLVAQLHLGYGWLAASLVLAALSQLAAAWEWAPLQGAFYGAGLHALSLGFMATMLLAMASRVTAVQYGRSLAVDRGLWLMQALLQALAVARVAAALVSAWPLRMALLLASAAAFALLALVWGGRYLPWLLRSKKRVGMEVSR